jgi:hypothetical protein
VTHLRRCALPRLDEDVSHRRKLCVIDRSLRVYTHASALRQVDLKWKLRDGEESDPKRRQCAIIVLPVDRLATSSSERRTASSAARSSPVSVGATLAILTTLAVGSSAFIHNSRPCAGFTRRGSTTDPRNLQSTPSHAWSRTIACRCAATPTPATGSAPGARPAGTSPATCCRSEHLSGCPRGGVAKLGRSPGVRHRCPWHQKTQASGRGITRDCSASADHSSPRHYWPSTLHRRRSAVSACAAVWQQLSSGFKES